VALQAVLRQQRLHVTVEVDARRIGLLGDGPGDADIEEVVHLVQRG
jgi:hypothetical protein